MLKCEEIKESFSLYIDKALNEEMFSDFNQHIDSCETCRKELEELAFQVKLCKDIEEENLPLDFKEKLHIRLEVEKKNQEKQKITFIQRYRYLKIGSSIAAGVVLIIIIGSIVGSLNLRMGNTPMHEEPAKYAAKADAPAAEAAKAAEPAAPEADVKVTAKKDTGFINENDGSNSLAKGNNQENAYSVSGSDDTRNAEKAFKAKEFGEADNNTQKFTTSMAVDTITNRNTRITITTDMVSDSIDKISAYAAVSGAELISSDRSRLNEDVSVKATSDVIITETALMFKVSNSQIDKFENILKENFNLSDIAFGAVVTVDISAKVSQLEKNLNDLNTKIESGEVSNPDDLKRYISERDSILTELERLKLNSNFTIVEVILIKK